MLPGLTSLLNTNTYFTVDLGGDKMASLRNGYARSYARLLASRLNRTQTLVELGVFQGVSLALWCDLFPEATIIGLDIDFARFDSHRTALVERGAFSSNAPLLTLFDAFVPDSSPLIDELSGRSIDVFVDDGPHHIEAIVATAKVVVPLMGPDSLYVVEDQSKALEPLREAFPALGFRMEGPLVVAEIPSRAV